MLGAIDDATGKVVYAGFRPNEDQIGYLLMLRTVALRYGLPTFSITTGTPFCALPNNQPLKTNWPAANRRAKSNGSMNSSVLLRFRRSHPKPKVAWRVSGKPLRIDSAKRCASPALFRWSRPTSSSRLLLPAYNQRFAKPARDPESAWRPLHPELDLDRLFSTATERKVKADHTISFRGLTLQMLREKEQPCLVACKVMVHVTPESELHLYHHDTKLAYRQLVQAATPPLVAKPPTPVPAKTPKPSDPNARRRRNAYLFGNY